MNYGSWISKGALRMRQKDLEKIKSMINSAQVNAKVAGEIKINDNTATLIFREIYESIRQLGDAKTWILGYEPLNHEVSMEILKEFDIKDKVKLNSLDRIKKIRHDINYRGFRASIGQAKEILEFWNKCGVEILDLLKKEVMKVVKITYFVHGTTTDNQKNISSGWKDAQLSELGIKQSRELANQIGNKKFDIVFCSDLKRAVESAEISFKGKFPIKIDKRLRECNYGDFNGKSSEIVEKMQEKCIEINFPNGESYGDVKARIIDFLKFLKDNYDGKHIAIVAHKAPQLALDVLLNEKTWEQAFAQDWRKRKAWQPGWEYELKSA
jgi:broad specificity phosphatase PhoE